MPFDWEQFVITFGCSLSYNRWNSYTKNKHKIICAKEVRKPTLLGTLLYSLSRHHSKVILLRINGSIKIRL